MAEKRASIIIVTYNGVSYLEQCLSSVQQNTKDDCEIVVVDNASNDGSADFVERQYPQVVLIRNKRNLGFAQACNQGARAASGLILVFLNQDTRVMPGWLDALADGLVGERRVALTTSKILVMSQPDRIYVCGVHVHYTGLAFGRGSLASSDSMVLPQRVAAVAGASFAVRREVWAALGGLDEAFFMYYEETDLSWRAQLAGYSCLYVPGSVVYHDYHPSRLSMDALYYSARNRWVMLLKNWKWATLVLLAPSLLLADLLDWGLAVVRGKSAVSAKVRANVWVVSHLPQILQLRKKTQSQRRVSDAVLLRERTSQLMPAEVTGGAVGRAIVAVASVLFELHYRGMLWLIGKLNL